MQSYSSKIMPGLQVVSSTKCIRTVQSSQSCSFKSSRYKLLEFVFSSKLVTAVTKKAAGIRAHQSNAHHVCCCIDLIQQSMPLATQHGFTATNVCVSALCVQLHFSLA